MTCAIIPNETQQKFLCHSERSEVEWRIPFWFTSLFLTTVEILPSSEWQAQVEPISWFVIISGLSFWTQRSGVKNLFMIGDSSFVRMTFVVITKETQQKFHCHSERSEAEWRISFWFISLFLTIVEILPSSEWHASSFLTKRSRNSTVILNGAKRSEESLYDWRFFLRQNDMRHHS